MVGKPNDGEPYEDEWAAAADYTDRGACSRGRTGHAPRGSIVSWTRRACSVTTGCLIVSSVQRPGSVAVQLFQSILVPPMFAKPIIRRAGGKRV